MLLSLLTIALLTVALSYLALRLRHTMRRLRIVEISRNALEEKERRRQQRGVEIDRQEGAYQTGGDVPDAFAEYRGSVAESRRLSLAEACSELGIAFNPDAEYNEPAMRFALQAKRADQNVTRLERARQMLLSALDASELRGSLQRGLQTNLHQAVTAHLAALKNPPADLAVVSNALLDLLTQGPDPDGDFVRVRQLAVNTYGSEWKVCPNGCGHFLFEHLPEGGCVYPHVTGSEVVARMGDRGCSCSAVGNAPRIRPVPMPRPPRRRGRRR